MIFVSWLHPDNIRNTIEAAATRGLRKKFPRYKYDGTALRAIRAEKGVGRPLKPKTETVADFYPMIARKAVAKHGSQRRAAAALGISLGKLQRELKKAAA